MNQHPVYDEEYFVEKILAKREYPELKYLIKWEGWDIKDSTWEPLENLTNAMALVDEFEKNWAVKQHEKREQQENQLKRSKQVLERYYDSADLNTPSYPLSKKRFNPTAEERQEQKTYRDYKSDVMKKSKKSENILMRFPTEDEPEDIKTVKLIKNAIHCLVSFKPRPNGIKSEDAYIPSAILADKIPIMLIDFYESKIKFIQ